MGKCTIVRVRGLENATQPPLSVPSSAFPHRSWNVSRNHRCSMEMEVMLWQNRHRRNRLLCADVVRLPIASLPLRAIAAEGKVCREKAVQQNVASDTIKIFTALKQKSDNNISGGEGENCSQREPFPIIDI